MGNIRSFQNRKGILKIGVKPVRLYFREVSMDKAISDEALEKLKYLHNKAVKEMANAKNEVDREYWNGYKTGLITFYLWLPEDVRRVGQ